MVSAFGLQQLPEPDLALRSWAATLRAGGQVSVVFRPGATEVDGLFACLARVLRTHVPARDASWEQRLAPTLTACGTRIERDDRPACPMSHPDAATFFDAIVRFGPLRPLATARGNGLWRQPRRAGRRRAGHRRPKCPWSLLAVKDSS
ncbi:hypothetical protein WEH80_26705 [Actinomycetes bacterium KLBMP 9759]